MSTARGVHRLAVASYLGLMGLLLLWLIWLAPLPASIRSPALLILLGPLLLPLRGILHGRRYTMAWSSMLILLYFLHGVTAVAGGGRAAWLGGLEIVLALVYFAFAIHYVRLSNPAAPAGDGGKP